MQKSALKIISLITILAVMLAGWFTQSALSTGTSSPTPTSASPYTQEFRQHLLVSGTFNTVPGQTGI